MKEIILKTADSYLRGEKPLLSALEYPIWNYITQTFDYTRSYEKALIFSANVLQQLEINKTKLSQKKYEEQIWLIYHFVFRNIYKLDLWQDYLDSCEL